MAITPFSDPSALSLQIPSLASHYINYKWQSSPGLSGSRQSLETFLLFISLRGNSYATT